MAVVYILITILFYYVLLEGLLPARRRKNEEQIQLLNGDMVNPRTLSASDFRQTKEYNFIFDNLHKYPAYKKYRIGDRVSGIDNFETMLRNNFITMDSWRYKYELDRYEKDLDSAFRNLLSSYDAIVREYQLFKNYISTQESPNAGAAATKTREAEMARNAAEIKRQQEEYKKKIEEDQRKSLDRLLFNRKLTLVPITDGDRQGGTYIIKNEKNSNIYVGSTRCFYERKKRHLSALRARRHHSFRLQEDFNQSGEESLSFFIIKSIRFDKWSQNGLLKNLPAELKLKKYRLYLQHEEAGLIRLLNPYYNIESDTRGTRHWRDDVKYSGYRDM